jgi:hypothetical protein
VDKEGIDAETEELVIESLERLMEGKTTIASGDL